MSDQSYQSFTELNVWEKARELKNEIQNLINTFPSEERFRLSDQLIRSSRSIYAAIAEGHGRFSFKDQLHFCIIAWGSLSETLNHLIDAFDCKYISNEQLNNYKSNITKVEKLLNGNISHLRKII